MTRFIQVRPNGRIEMNGECPADQLQYQKEEGCTLVESEGVFDRHYYDWALGGPVEKTNLGVGPQVDGLTVTFPGIPAGSLIQVEGHELVADASGAVVEFDMPGTYFMRVVPPPQFFDFSLEVTVG